MISFASVVALALSFVYSPAFCVPQEQLASVTASEQFLQSGPAPDLAGPATATTPSCGGCYLVADVAGLVWYSEVFINTAATAFVSVGVGNGTSATRTSIVENEGAFTFNPTATVSGGALTQLNYQPTVNVGGAILTSPTAYNVFTAYSITSAYSSNGVCITTSGAPVTLSSAYTETLVSANGQVVLDANGQKAFIDFLGFSTCSGGGENVVPTALIQITNTTTSMTSTFSNVPLAAASATLTIAPQSIPIISASPGSTTGAPSTTVFPSAAVPKIVIGNNTITPTPNPIGLSIFTGTLSGTTTTVMGITSGGYIIPTGGNYTQPIAFTGKAPLNRVDFWLTTVWSTVMMGLGVFVYYL